MKYEGYLFDFDGTIADTGEGICKSVAYSLEKLGRPVPEMSTLKRFVGPPLHDSYMEYCGLTEEEVERISTENGIRFFGLPSPES